MVKWSVDDIYDIKKDESVCNSCYSPILWVHVIWSKQLFIVICLVFLVSRFPWGHSTTTWIKFDPILTTYPLEWKIVDILPIQSKDKLFYPMAWATAYGWRPKFVRGKYSSMVQHCTEVRFAGSLSGESIIAIVVNPPERKLAKQLCVVQ